MSGLDEARAWVEEHRALLASPAGRELLEMVAGAIQRMSWSVDPAMPLAEGAHLSARVAEIRSQARAVREARANPGPTAEDVARLAGLIARFALAAGH